MNLELLLSKWKALIGWWTYSEVSFSLKRKFRCRFYIKETSLSKLWSLWELWIKEKFDFLSRFLGKIFKFFCNFGVLWKSSAHSSHAVMKTLAYFEIFVLIILIHFKIKTLVTGDLVSSVTSTRLKHRTDVILCVES